MMLNIKKRMISFLAIALITSTLFFSHETKPMYNLAKNITDFFTQPQIPKKLIIGGIEDTIKHGTTQICLSIAAIPVTLAFNKVIGSFFGPSKDKIIQHDAALLYLEAIKEKEQSLQYATQATQLLAVQLQELAKDPAQQASDEYKELETKLAQIQILQKQLIKELGDLTSQAALQAFEKSNKKLEDSEQQLALIKKA